MKLMLHVCSCLGIRGGRPTASEESNISLNVHPTTEVLLQKRVAWVFDILDVRHSSASQFFELTLSTRGI